MTAPAADPARMTARGVLRRRCRRIAQRAARFERDWSMAQTEGQRLAAAARVLAAIARDGTAPPGAHRRVADEAERLRALVVHLLDQHDQHTRTRR